MTLDVDPANAVSGTIGANSGAGTGAASLDLTTHTFSLSGDLLVGGGASAQGALNFGPGCTLALGGNNLRLGNCKLTSSATSVAWASITATTGTITNNAGVSSNPRMDVVLTYVLHDFGGGAITYPLGDGSALLAGWVNRLNIQHCTFVGSGITSFGASGATVPADISVVTNYNDFRNTGRIQLNSTITPTTGLNQFRYNTVSLSTKASLVAIRPNCDCLGSVFSNCDINATTTGMRGGHTFDGCFFTLPDAAAAGSGLITLNDGYPAVTIQGSYFYGNYDNEHVINHTSSGGTGTHAIHGNVFELRLVSDPPNTAFIGPLATDFYENLCLGFQELIGNIGAISSGTQRFYNNTVYQQGDADYAGIGVLFTCDGSNTGGIQVYNNLLAADTSFNMGVKNLGTSDFTLAYLGYNGWYNVTTAYVGTNFGSGGATAYMVVTDDHTANDVVGDPSFVDSTRRLSAWTAGGGIGTPSAANAIAYLLAINGYNGTTKTQSDTPSAQGAADLVTWVRAGFKVQAAALNNAGLGGVTIGACDYLQTSRGSLVGGMLGV